MRNLLTLAQAKTDKSATMGWLTAILHLAPHTSAGLGNLCTDAVKACMAVCIYFTGRAGIFAAADTKRTKLADGRTAKTNSILRARIARTVAFFEEFGAFERQLVKEVAAHVRRAARLDLRPCMRPNGTSDVQWEDVKLESGLTLFEMFPAVQFYDYTKHLERVLAHPYGWPAPNYCLTYSFNGEDYAAADRVLRHGGTVAVVFSTKRGEALPDVWLGRPVVDGDEHDLVFLRHPGVVIGLRAKGKAKRLPVGGFVQQG